MCNKVAEMLTDRFIAEMEKGIVPWHKPWALANGGKGAISHSTGKPYNFINQMFLEEGEYITFEQCKKEGGKVKKGVKAEKVFQWIYKEHKVLDEDGNPILNSNGEEETVSSYALTYCNVFNIKDVEGIEPKVFGGVTEEPVEIPDAEKIIDSYIKNNNISLEFGGDEAYYCSTTDSITLPHKRNFKDNNKFYSVVFHEMTHSTGHSKRLNRVFGSRKGDSNYSKEELVAEIGAAALVNYCGLETSSTFANSTAYLQSWLQALKNDKTMLMTAATKAQKAYEYILNS